jgi:predicted nucleic acid-binding protein
MASRVEVSASWGEDVSIADTSAWARAKHFPEQWKAAIANGQIAASEMVTFELLYSVHDGAQFDARVGELALLPQAPVTPAVLSNARVAFRTLAHRHPLFHRSVTIADVITAAAAADAGIGVLHYDADYDTLADVLPFESRWIAPRGSLD